MRPTGTLRASLVIAVLASCGRQSDPCTPPIGCVRAGNVAGACQCQEWEIVSVEPVPMKYMVVGIVYQVLGNESQVSYGHSAPSSDFLATSSEFGSRWRSAVRSSNGSETVATLGPIDMTDTAQSWPPLKPVTATSGALTVPENQAWAYQMEYDVISHAYDQIWLWLNPSAAVLTDRAGRKTVAWSTPDRHVANFGAGPMVWTVLAGWLDGTMPMPAFPPLDPPLDASDLAAILRHDPFFASSTAPDAATFAADPRYHLLGRATVGGGVRATPVTGWACGAPITDANFPVLDTAEVPFGDREALVLQSSMVGVEGACTVQTPGLVLGTSTPGCRFEADVFVDTVFGTLLMVPASVDPACTVAP